MRYITLIILLFILIPIGYVRFSVGDPGKWHVDPTTAVRGPKPNQFFMLPVNGDIESPVFNTDAATLAQTFNDLVMNKPSTRLLAGGPSELFVTYMQRSRYIGYPDYISVKFFDLEDGSSTLAIYSRARYGRSDFGVNRARIKNWVKALEQFIAG